MSKKILLTLLLSCIIFSCGKKGDPEYKKSKKDNVQILIRNNA